MRELRATGVDRLRDATGLPLSTYFSGPKIGWILDNVDGARERAEAGELAFGTIDTWLIWNLTGGGRRHVTDVTNASRTLLMDLETLDWHEPSARADGHPARDAARDPLARSEAYGEADGHRARRRADRRASSATSRRRCSARPASSPGEAKNTYGTGCFLLVNTGDGGRAHARSC